MLGPRLCGATKHPRYRAGARDARANVRYNIKFSQFGDQPFHLVYCLADVAIDPDVTTTVDMDDTSSLNQGAIYGGWVASAIAPLAEFIDMPVNPRDHYVDLRDIAESSGGTMLYVARLDPARHERLMLPEDVRELDEDDVSAERPTFVAIKTVPIMPAGSSKLGEVVRERRILSDVHCENILHMDALYVDPVEDALWIRMELMTRTLSSVIELNGVGLVLSDRMIAGCTKDASFFLFDMFLSACLNLE